MGQACLGPPHQPPFFPAGQSASLQTCSPSPTTGCSLSDNRPPTDAGSIEDNQKENQMEILIVQTIGSFSYIHFPLYFLEKRILQRETYWQHQNSKKMTAEDPPDLLCDNSQIKSCYIYAWYSLKSLLQTYLCWSINMQALTSHKFIIHQLD